jgi:hypothetical protein
MLDVIDGLARFRPSGGYSLVDAVDLISRAISQSRDQDVDRLLINVTAMTGVSIPSLLDRFLMAEDWALASQRRVTVAMVAHAEYIHPKKFGVKVASHFGLIVDVFTTEREAVQWLREQGGSALGDHG